MGIGENVGEAVGENTGQTGYRIVAGESLVACYADDVESNSEVTSPLITGGNGVAAPTYTPIIADDMESYTGYETPPANNSETDELFGSIWSTRSITVTERSHSGTQSHRFAMYDGSVWFGGLKDFPSTYGAGNTLWYRAYFYFPETFSFSGGANSDFWSWGKFMELARFNHDDPRIYLQLPSTRYADYGDADFAPSGISITNDESIPSCGNINPSWTVPRDQWVALQLAIKLSTTDGWFRVWADETYLGGCASSIPVGYTVGEWGIGNYWNGNAWVKNNSTDFFFMDDVIITIDEPNTTDSSGRPYIHPDHYPSDFP